MTTTMPLPRTERLFGSDPVTEEDLKALASWELRELSCPKCGGIMTMVKVSSRKGDYETVTFQCHNPNQGKMCLYVLQGTDSVPYFMRPGDFDNGDIGWKSAASETIPAKDVKKLVSKKLVKPKKPFDKVPVRPMYPGTRETLNKVIWDFFWDGIMLNGRVDIHDLEFHVRIAKGNGRKVTKALDTVQQMIVDRSGYVVRINGECYEIAGRGIGAKGVIGEPYSTEEYRKVHGFLI